MRAAVSGSAGTELRRGRHRPPEGGDARALAGCSSRAVTPNFSVADVHNGWSEALTALGEDVREYAMDRRLTFYDTVLIETGEKDEEGHLAVRKALTREQAQEMAANG